MYMVYWSCNTVQVKSETSALQFVPCFARVGHIPSQSGGIKKTQTSFLIKWSICGFDQYEFCHHFVNLNSEHTEESFSSKHLPGDLVANSKTIISPGSRLFLLPSTLLLSAMSSSISSSASSPDRSSSMSSSELDEPSLSESDYKSNQNNNTE